MIIIIFLKFMNTRGIRLKIGIKEIKEEIILPQPLQRLL